MDFGRLEKRIREQSPATELRAFEPMSRHTSFRIGGPAALMALPRSREELIRLVGAAAEEGITPFVFGNGTNLLVRDGLWDAFLIKTAGVCALRREGSDILADGGALLSAAAVLARKSGLAGLEFAHGIPGTAGGGAVMNAGAYGGELKDVCVEAEYLDSDLQVKTAAGGELGFSYRRSAFSGGKSTLLGLRLRLREGDGDAIQARMEELSARRRASQPLDMPSAGSVFKRPAGGYAAALIDAAGLKGLSCGGAQVSEKHAGFIVNRGGATCDDVLRLMETVQKRVYENSGILLEAEIKTAGGAEK